ncbi:MAG: hypothetical protein V3U92_03330 [Cellulophaga sp.]
MSQIIFQVYSPDRFSIMGNKSFNSLNEAKENFIKWSKRFEGQGYYASIDWRIPLHRLEQYCTYKKLHKNECDELELVYLSRFVNYINLPKGSVEWVKHYELEFERIKRLADTANGNIGNELYMELDDIKMILKSYLS